MEQVPHDSKGNAPTYNPIEGMRSSQVMSPRSPKNEEPGSPKHEELAADEKKQLRSEDAEASKSTKKKLGEAKSKIEAGQSKVRKVTTSEKTYSEVVKAEKIVAEKEETAMKAQEERQASKTEDTLRKLYLLSHKSLESKEDLDIADQ